ncbi:DNA-directed RNA polymerase subunit omega [Natranaerobius trueperi]|uniref:DNA-directed RNA polymerase subunit omega n=1 Tax=Natranaerobius trueperi TaxID=759412 RepID=A0A226C1B1_9FIRM|nr:DNA-directed RNA polymerase subunit omega [Natranaerobius trueperi]OWZ84160.1 DNA-directed RNA polymerase subunit omega [Natranaerobius trueperi]
MVNNLDIDNLIKKVDSKYSLVIGVAKRARDITDNSEALVHSNSQKSVTVALKELDRDKINITR